MKIGSVDTLMQLNETAARIDNQLDGVCKKIEKIHMETRGDREQGKLTYRPNYEGEGSKFAPTYPDFNGKSIDSDPVFALI